MKSTLFAGSIIVLALSACSTKEDSSSKTNFNNDFETVGYWTESPKVVRDASHSGNFATFTDSSSIYSQTLNVRVKDLKVKDIKAITASVWVLSNAQDAKGKFVLSIEKDGKNIVWQGVETQKSMHEVNKWAEVKLRVDLKAKLYDDMILKLYGINDGVRRIYWDDFSINFEE